MTKTTIFLLGLLLITPGMVKADGEILTGDVRLACEALLCLSSSTRPGECGPCLARYFDINERKWSDTIQARLSFLRGCPVVRDTPDMGDLAQVIVNSAGRCDASYLNRTLTYTIEHTGSMGEVYYTTHIRSVMPGNCLIWQNSYYTDVRLPQYVGDELKDGRWVDQDDFSAFFEK